MGHMKSKKDFRASSDLFQWSVIAYNTARWMSLLSKNKTMKKWESAVFFNKYQNIDFYLRAYFFIKNVAMHKKILTLSPGVLIYIQRVKIK
jgi:hypothetical protein